MRREARTTPSLTAELLPLCNRKSFLIAERELGRPKSKPPCLPSQTRWLIIFVNATKVIEWTIADAGGADFIESWLIQHYDFPKIFPAISL
jgi:hypothetical protein